MDARTRMSISMTMSRLVIRAGSTPCIPVRFYSSPPPSKPWQKRDSSIKKRYGEWNPTRKLTREQMDDVRLFYQQMPHLKTIDLANYFSILPEAIRRILKSKWAPSEEVQQQLKVREETRKEMKKLAKAEGGKKERVKSIHINELIAKGEYEDKP